MEAYRNSYSSAVHAVKDLEPSFLFGHLVDRSRELFKQAKKIQIVSQAKLQKAAALLGELKEEMNSIEEKKKEFSKELQQYVAKMQRAVRGILSPLKEAEQELKAKMQIYRAVLEEQSRNHRQRVEAALEEEDLEPLQKRRKIEELAPDPEKVIRSEAGTVSERVMWDFEVVDVKQVPTKFLQVNTTAVREAIRNGSREIAGITIFQKKVSYFQPSRMQGSRPAAARKESKL